MRNYILLVWDRNEENPELYLIPRNEIDAADYCLIIEANGKYISVKDQDDYLWKLKKLLDDEWDKYLVVYEMLTLAEDQHIDRVITSGFIIDQKASYGNHYI